MLYLCVGMTNIVLQHSTNEHLICYGINTEVIAFILSTEFVKLLQAAPSVHGSSSLHLQQESVVKVFVQGQDMFVSLLTGSWKFPMLQ